MSRRNFYCFISKIYIRTAFAWYILDTPSTIYSPFFSPFWIQHRILHLIVTQSWANPRLTYDTFIKSLEITPESPDSVAIAIKVIGRSLTESDVQSDNAVRINPIPGLRPLTSKLSDHISYPFFKTYLIRTTSRSIGFLSFVLSEGSMSMMELNPPLLLTPKGSLLGKRIHRYSITSNRTFFNTRIRPLSHPESAESLRACLNSLFALPAE